MLERVETQLAAAGYHRYELSNYARPGAEAVHNRRYWERRPVLGLGLGAVSTDPPTRLHPFGVRRQRTRDLAGYLAQVERGTPPPAEAAMEHASLGNPAGNLRLTPHGRLLSDSVFEHFV